MRILLVEDNIDFAKRIEKEVQAIDRCHLTWRRSKAGALEALDEDYFDVIILDRRIPTVDDYLDDHQDHGWAVFQTIVEAQPGTSVWFLTGTVDDDFGNEVLNEHGKRGDIHARGKDDALYKVFWKKRISECLRQVREFCAEIQVTEDIHLGQVGAAFNLRSEEARIIKLFGRRHKGSRVEVRMLQGGLSGARVFRVSVFNAADAVVITSVARIGRFEEIEVERRKYQTEIVKLANGAFPPVTGELNVGAAGFSGILYQVVGHEVQSLFDVLMADVARATEAVARLRQDQAIWHGARKIEKFRVSDVRRALIGDVTLEGHKHLLDGIDLSDVENIEIDVARCIQHCDLHCGNVLFDDGGRPMVIDYPETGLACASLDPVALELSTIFHRDAPDRAGWPSELRAELWPDVDGFCSETLHEQFIRSCRAWAHGVAASPQEVLAVAYAYALRQVKYEDTDKALVRAIVRGCMVGLMLNSD